MVVMVVMMTATTTWTTRRTFIFHHHHNVMKKTWDTHFTTACFREIPVFFRYFQWFSAAKPGKLGHTRSPVVHTMAGTFITRFSAVQFRPKTSDTWNQKTTWHILTYHNYHKLCWHRLKLIFKHLAQLQGNRTRSSLPSIVVWHHLRPWREAQPLALEWWIPSVDINVER